MSVERINVSMNAEGDSPEAKTAQQEHDAKMAALADDTGTTIRAKDKDGNVLSHNGTEANNAEPENETVQRPDDIPEKFWDAEKGEVNVAALLKSQQDAEAALQGKKPESKDDAEEEGEEKPAAQPEVVSKATEEYAEKGELSEETYKSLEAAGLSKDMVNDYIEGQKAIIGNLRTAAFSEFDGGEDTYLKAVDWARENMTEAEIAAIDVQLGSTNPAIIAQGAKALNAQYQANADITPTNQIVGNNGDASKGTYFKSGKEMQTAMADPRYKTDGAFRADVAGKIARAEAAGVSLF